MKKTIKVFSVGLLSAIITVSVSISAFAAGINNAEKKILSTLRTTITIKDEEKSLPVNYINQAENYFNTVEITDVQADKIIKRIETAKDYLISTGALNYDALTDAQIDTLIEKCQYTVDVINLKISYSKSEKIISITDSKGKTIFTAKLGNSNNNGSQTVVDDNPIKVTGFDFNIPGAVLVAGTGIFLVSAAGIFLVRKSKRAVYENNV